MPLRRYDDKVVCKVVERAISIGVANGTERQCSSIEPYGLVEIKQDAPPLESV
jgi:hypothetical protein